MEKLEMYHHHKNKKDLNVCIMGLNPSPLGETFRSTCLGIIKSLLRKNKKEAKNGEL